MRPELKPPFPGPKTKRELNGVYLIPVVMCLNPGGCAGSKLEIVC